MITDMLYRKSLFIIILIEGIAIWQIAEYSIF